MKTPHELACAISALVNSQPRSPTVAELEGVIREHWQPIEWKPFIAYDPEAVADAIREMNEAREEITGIAELQCERAPVIADKSDVLAELVECADELRGAAEPTNREIAHRVLAILREAKAIPTPPMTVVVERMRDNICLGGVAYMSGKPWGNWLPPRVLDEPSGD